MASCFQSGLVKRAAAPGDNVLRKLMQEGKRAVAVGSMLSAEAFDRQPKRCAGCCNLFSTPGCCSTSSWGSASRPEFAFD